jgi:hypothetical protein
MARSLQNRDGRDKPGHDELNCGRRNLNWQLLRIRQLKPNLTRLTPLVQIRQVGPIVIADTNGEGIAEDPLHETTMDANGDVGMRLSLGELQGKILDFGIVRRVGVEHRNQSVENNRMLTYRKLKPAMVGHGRSNPKFVSSVVRM